MQAHSAATSGFPLCQESASAVHQHPQTQGNVRLHNLRTEFQLMFMERLSKVYCCTARKNMTNI